LKRILHALCAALLMVSPTFAGTVTGTLQSANGTPISNGTIGFTLAQAGLIVGTGAVVPITSACYTSTDGSVVGVANPLHAPSVSVTTSGGLPAGNYYVQLTARTSDGHETLPSPEVIVALPSGGAFTVTYADPYPSGYVLGVKAYIGTSSGSETLQGQSSGTIAYTQSSALTSGAAEPTTNSTICSIAFNDTIIPYSGYKVSLTSSGGDAYPGYPQMWQLNGGLNGTVNISAGAPLWNGTVIYPQPIMAQPLNHGPQSISGPLGMSGYDIFGVGELGIGTNTPGWPLDIESGFGNAQGWLVNGNGGTVGKCLGSDGNAYDTPIACLTSVGTIFYQVLQANGISVTQRATANLVPPLTAADNGGASRTDISIATTGNGTKVVTQGTTLPGATTNCAHYDGGGNLIPASGPCMTSTIQSASNITGCSMSSPSSYDTCTVSLTWPVAFADNGYQVSCMAINPFDTGNSTPARVVLNGTTSTGKSTTGVTVIISSQGTSSGSVGVSGVDCIGIHP
jgi:hypothetical protein